MNQKNESAKELCRIYFKDDYGQPLEITDGQVEIFNSIWLKNNPRVNVIASTQYGKSTIIACALILRTRATGENWAIVAGRQDKARIIMEKVIQHTFDNPVLVENLDLDKNEPLERIKRERSKERITWKSGGEIRIYSAQTKSTKNVNDALTGFGCIRKGEKILTDKGYIEIRHLVKNKKAVKVASFNHISKRVEFRKILEYQKNPIAERYFIEISVGSRKFICTNDHPVFVKGKGYVRADKIKRGDRLLALD
jgi:hypothetical protein